MDLENTDLKRTSQKITGQTLINTSNGQKKFCPRCNTFHYLSQFPAQTSSSTQLHTYCRECKNIYAASRLEQIRDQVFNLKGSCCAICGLETDRRVFDYHHIDGENKENTISHLIGCLNWDRLLDELPKCVLLCPTCHRKVHVGLISLPVEYTGVDPKSSNINPTRGFSLN